jgi:hypothetical protein
MSGKKSPKPVKRDDDISSMIKRIEKLVETSDKEEKKKESTKSKNASKPRLSSSSRSSQGEKKDFDYSRLLIKVPVATKDAVNALMPPITKGRKKK